MRNERAFAARRREAGLDLQQAAVRLGISERYLRVLERGRARLSLPLAQKMVATYRTTITDLTRPACAGGTGNGRAITGKVARPVGVDRDNHRA